MVVVLRLETVAGAFRRLGAARAELRNIESWEQSTRSKRRIICQLCQFIRWTVRTAALD